MQPRLTSDGVRHMKARLTDALLRSIKPPEGGRVVLRDTERPGLQFRVTTKGVRSWLVQKQVKGGERLSVTLGRYPDVSLSQARAEALKIEFEAMSGVNRVEAAAAQEMARAAEAAQARSVKDILELYINRHVRPNLKEGQSRDERERQLRTYLAPLLGIRMDQLARADLQRIVDTKAAEGKIIMANRLRSALCAFTAWSFNRDYIAIDPGAKVQKAGPENARTRTPSLSEVREIWSASYGLGDLWGPYMRLAVLLGQRSRKEVLEMQWSWVDYDGSRLKIPTTKNKRPHLVHLPEPALAELSGLRAHQHDREMETPFVFTTTGGTPASGLSKAKTRLDDIINQARMQNDDALMPHWVLHDLRRSQATVLAEAGFSEAVVDRLQNHVAVGSRPSQVAQVYQLADMLSERARALNHWADLVTCQEAENTTSLRVWGAANE